MKPVSSFLLACALLVPAAAHARQASPPSDTLRAVEFTVVERLPSVDQTEIARLVEANYPPESRQAGVSGKVEVRFVLDSEGSVTAPRITESSGSAELDAAALRVVGQLRLKPAVWHGRPYPIWVNLPLQFGASTGGGTSPGKDVDSEGVQPPTLLNQAEIAGMLVRNYPPFMRDAGIPGNVEVTLHIDEQGVPVDVRITAANHPDFVVPAARVARLMRFNPARRGDSPVRTWVALPITFGRKGATK